MTGHLVIGTGAPMTSSLLARSHRARPHVIDLMAAGAIGQGRIRFEPSGIERSTQEVWQASEAVARWLRRSVGTGVRVGALLTNTPDCPAVVFGVWRSGNTLVSLPYPGRAADPQEYIAQISRMCELADVQLLLVDEVYRALLPPLPVPVAGFTDAFTDQPVDDAELPLDLDPGGHLIQFTSGSLGRPKGVLLTGEALAANILAISDAIDLVPGSRAATWLPLSHDMGFVGMFLTSIANLSPAVGGELLLLQTPESFLADPASWLRLCSQHRVTVTTAPNFAFELAVRSAPFLKQIDLSALQVCITGAERVRAHTLRRFAGTFAGNGLDPAAICPAYGMAEAALAVTLVRPDRPWRELALDRSALGAGRAEPVTGRVDQDINQDDVVHYVSNGPVVNGLDVRIAGTGPEDGEAGGVCRVGEVQIRGTSLFSDYLGAQRTLTPDGWFPTRDVGFIHEGELYLVGRTDETIIVGGQNHYASDIEHAVQHELVRPGSLAAIPLDAGFALLAEPVGAPDERDLARACQELARQSVARAGLRPSMVGFLPRGALRKTPSGKVQRLSMSTALAEGSLTLLSSVWLDQQPQPISSR